MIININKDIECIIMAVSCGVKVNTVDQAHFYA
jgi:hypothetical protein